MSANSDNWKADVRDQRQIADEHAREATRAGSDTGITYAILALRQEIRAFAIQSERFHERI